jgi:hypothetical protein
MNQFQNLLYQKGTFLICQYICLGAYKALQVALPGGLCKGVKG